MSRKQRVLSVDNLLQFFLIWNYAFFGFLSDDACLYSELRSDAE
jgi:hypothetical protein